MKNFKEKTSAIPCYEKFITMEGLKEALLKEANNERESFVDLASKSIVLHALNRATPNSQTSILLQNYNKKGVSKETIAKALAISWFENKSYFELQADHLNTPIYHRGLIFLVCLVVALLLSFIGLWICKTFLPRLTSTLLILEPILAGIGFILTIVFYEIWLKIAKQK